MSTGIDPKWCACMKRQVIDCSCPPSSPWRNSPGLDAQLNAISEAATFGPLIASKRWPIDLESDAKAYRADRIEALETALTDLIAACESGKRVERGAGGMTIDAQIDRTIINGVPARAVESARAALNENKSGADLSTNGA